MGGPGLSSSPPYLNARDQIIMYVMITTTSLLGF